MLFDLLIREAYRQLLDWTPDWETIEDNWLDAS